MSPTVPVPSALAVEQPEIGLVDKCGGLEGLPGLLVGQPLGSQLAQLVVDQREKSLGSVWLAVIDRREDRGDFGHGRRSSLAIRSFYVHDRSGNAIAPPQPGREGGLGGQPRVRINPEAET